MEKQLDVLFINPGDTKQVYQHLSNTLSGIEPPIFCGLYANFMRSKGFGVDILDVPDLGLSAELAAVMATDLNPKLVVMVVYGFQPSASTQNMPSAGKICRFIKEKNPQTKILITGTHPAALPDRTLREESVDFVCTGEAPLTILHLTEAIRTRDTDYSKVGDLCYWDDGSVALTNHLPLIKDLNEEMPGIAWDLLPMANYRAHNWHCWEETMPRNPYISLHTSLGCPYKCSFCCINTPFSGPNYSFNGPTYRMWSPKRVVEEIDFLVTKYGVRNIKIADEMFVLNPNHVFGICDGLIERGHDLNIWAYTRIDTTKEEFLERLLKAGILWLGIGIESGSKYVRDGSDKKFKNEKKNLLNVNENIINVVRRIQAAGLYAGCNYIFGLPDDTTETMQETLALAREINSEFANFYCAMAYPGSPLYVAAKSKGYPLPEDPGGPGWIGYSQHSYETLPLPPDVLTAAEVLGFRDEAFLSYFTSPEYLAMMDKKFGPGAVDQINEMTGHGRLKRQILGD